MGDRLTDAARSFLAGAELPLEWAARSEERATHVTRTEWACIGGSDLVDEVEDPADTSFRRSLLGEPAEYETEVLRGARAGRLEVKRRVVRRRAPDEYGPMVRALVRDVQLVPALDELGLPVLDRKGRPRMREQVIRQEVIEGPLSAVRRALPDAIERSRRARVGIYGGKAADRIFLLGAG